MNDWISVTEKVPPPMETVLLCVKGKVIPGWNESTESEEEASYCSWESWPEPNPSGEGVTHWIPLPAPPNVIQSNTSVYTGQLPDYPRCLCNTEGLCPLHGGKE